MEGRHAAVVERPSIRSSSVGGEGVRFRPLRRRGGVDCAELRGGMLQCSGMAGSPRRRRRRNSAEAGRRARPRFGDRVPRYLPASCAFADGDPFAGFREPYPKPRAPCLRRGFRRRTDRMIPRLFGAVVPLLPEDPHRRSDLGERRRSEPMLCNLRNEMRLGNTRRASRAKPPFTFADPVLSITTNVTSPAQTATPPSDPAGWLEAVRSEKTQTVRSSDPIPPLETSRLCAAAGSAPLRARVVAG